MAGLTRHAPRIGAVLYALWGLLHVVGGAVILQSALTGGATEALQGMGSALPAAEIPLIAGKIADNVIAFHAWNLMWAGGLALVIAITLNWRNSKVGYWLNLAIVAVADVGLIVFLLLPGLMTVSDGIWGPLLYVLALLFATIGLATEVGTPRHPTPLAAR